MKTLLIATFALATLTLAPSVMADEVDHHGHYDITCRTKNARGQNFTAEGYSEHARDYYVWRQVQEEANDECRLSGSWVCIERGCTERFHHEH